MSRVWNVKCKVECGVYSVECRVYSVRFRVLRAGVKCTVWGVEY